jgi:glyoxylase-like metal-dependent hydrolase (beta-lactamase superfamily II)
MILHQFYLNCLAHASYLVGDEASSTAAVIDPQRDIDQYLSFAAERGLTIRHVILTHFHADFIAGHLELHEQTGATIHLGRSAKAEYAFEPFGDGDSIAFGGVRLAALETQDTRPSRSRSSCSIVRSAIPCRTPC